MDELLFALVFLLVFGVPLAGAFAVGYALGSRRSPLRVTTAQRDRLETLVSQIQHDAYEHLLLGEPLAAIVVDAIRNAHPRSSELDPGSVETRPGSR